MTRRRRWTGVLLAAGALSAGVAHAVLVSPLAIFMDARARTAEVTLVNTTTTPEEVTIDLRYGYSTTDTNEVPMVPTFAPESVTAEAPSAARFTRVFPRRVVLAPGQSQTVRLFASPSPAIPDGEYWARFLATAKKLPDWTLSELINVARDIRLLDVDVSKFSHVLRDFRNYIHPLQQMSQSFSPDQHTVEICWQVLRAAYSQMRERASQVLV